MTNSSMFTLACFSTILRWHLNIQVFKALHYPKVLSEFFLRPLKQTTAPTFTAPKLFKLFLSAEIVSYLSFSGQTLLSTCTTKICGNMLVLCPGSQWIEKLALALSLFHCNTSVYCCFSALRNCNSKEYCRLISLWLSLYCFMLSLTDF